MHISEGILSTTELVVGGVVGASLLVLSYRALKPENITKVALFSALFFILSLIHIPLGPISIHLVGNGLLGYLLGAVAPLTIFVGLLFQALLFGYGGVSVLGVNFVIMALPALIIYLAISRSNKQGFIWYFLVGFLAIILSSLLLCITLWLNGEEFINLAKVVFLANLPLAVIEGLITMFLLKALDRSGFIRKIRCE